MKKLFLMFAALCCTMALNATSYSCHLKVTINGESTEQDQVPVEVVKNGDIYTLTLKNFILMAEGIALPVGNIELANVEGVDEYGYTTIHFNGPVNITPGDDPNYGEGEWMGPLLGEVPIDMTSRFINTAITANIDIDLSEMLGQVIGVSIFGVAPQLKGDVNEDNEVNISDVNNVIDIIVSQ